MLPESLINRSGRFAWDSRCQIFVRLLPLEIGLTHNLTHTAKKADGTSGADRTKNLIFSEQKGPETAECQQFPGFQSVGKDEVGSSNPPNSFKIWHSNSKVWVLFVLPLQPLGRFPA